MLKSKLVYLAAPLFSPGTKLLEVRICSVCLLPRQHAQKTEEDHNPKLKDILDPVHLVILVGVLSHQLRRAVGQELVLLDDDVPLHPDAAKVAELYQGEVRFEHQDVIQLDVEVTQVL